MKRKGAKVGEKRAIGGSRRAIFIENRGGENKERKEERGNGQWRGN